MDDTDQRGCGVCQRHGTAPAAGPIIVWPLNRSHEPQTRAPTDYHAITRNIFNDAAAGAVGSTATERAADAAQRMHELLDRAGFTLTARSHHRAFADFRARFIPAKERP